MSEGARWLHLVNLDGALGEDGESDGMGGAANLAALDRILAAVDVPVQFGGGVRSIDDVDRLLTRGVSRVILGTVAVREPQVVAEALSRYGSERIAVGIDARDGYVVIHGWVDTVDVRAVDLAARMAAQGVRRVIYTDVRRDGTLSGVNVQATRELARASGLGVIASGGVATLDDVRAVAAAGSEGVEGVIIGMALYRGTVSLAQAIRIAEEGE